MRTQRAVYLMTTAAAVSMWPLYGLAQTEGGFTLGEAEQKEPVVINTKSVEVGLGWFSDDSFRFGEYTGITDRGFYPIANFDLIWRDPFDSGKTRYLDFMGTNLGIDSRSARLEAGEQGKFGVFLEYRELPHFVTDDSATPFIGAGSDFLTLPAIWDPADNTPAADPDNMTELDNVLNPVRLKTERTRLGGGFSYEITDEWSFGASYEHEKKEGLESLAGIFASSGGSPRAAVLPRPIDYETQDAEVFVAYNSDKLQAELRYHLSQFDDNISSLSWTNPYDPERRWDPDQGFATDGFGRMALEPDNSAHTVALSMGYTVDPTTRIAGNFSYTKMTQDDDFLPYSTTGFGVDGIAFGPLPRDSLDGEMTRIHGALSLAKQFTPDLRFTAQYTFDDRDNDTPRDVYCYVHSDSIDQDPDCADPNDLNPDSDDARINRPYSRTEHDFEMEATYRIAGATKVGVGYHFEAINRDFTEVENTYEHTGSLKFSSALASFATGRVELSYSDRSGSSYIGNEPVLASHTPATISDHGGEDEFWEANPYLRKYYINDRRRYRVSTGLNLMPMDELNIGLMGSYDKSDYHGFPDDPIGLTDRNFTTGTIDVTYTPTDMLSLYGFFTYDRMKNKQVGYERTGGGNPSGPTVPGDPTVPTRFWTVDTLDQGYTIGVGADFTVIPDKLKFGVDYAFSHTDTHYSFGGSPTLGAEPVPDVKSTLHSAGVRMDYRFAPGATVGLFYRYEMFDNDDFQLETGSSLPYVITLGSTDFDYSAHLVGLTLRYEF